MAQFSRLHIWASGEVLFAADLNNEFNNLLNGFTPGLIDSASLNVGAMQASVNPGNIGTESLAVNLLGEIQRLRYQVKAITGELQWYVPPEATLLSLLNNSKYINPIFTADGTDPGKYGFVQNPISASLGISFSNTTTSAVSFPNGGFGSPTWTDPTSTSYASTKLGSFILTKGANPVEVGLGPVLSSSSTSLSGGVRAVILYTNTNYSQNPLAVNFHFALVKNTNAASSYPASSDAIIGFINFTRTSTTAPSFDNSGISLNIGNLTENFYIPFETIKFIDTSAAANTVKYRLDYWITLPGLTAIPGGSQQVSLSAMDFNTIFYGREII